MKRVLVASLLVLAACTPPEAKIAPSDPTSAGHGGGLTSTKRACDQSVTVSLVLMKDEERSAIDKQLDQGVVFVAMPRCDGSFEVVEGCHLAGSYVPAATEVVTQVDKVRSEEDAASFQGGKDALVARPGGFDVAMRGTVLKLDAKSMGSDPKGDRCADVTHIVTGAMRGGFKIGAADANTEPPAAGGKDLIAVHLRTINTHDEHAKPNDGHVETGIIAPH